MISNMKELGRAYLTPDERSRFYRLDGCGWERAIALAMRARYRLLFWVKRKEVGTAGAAGSGTTEVNVCTVGYDNPTHTLTFPFTLREFRCMVNDADIEGCQEQDRREARSKEVLDA